MHILSLSYTNIWPFAGATKTVTFLEGSSLVSAPIGSGKSFLFFDGPLFALYKYSSRPMLSRTSKKWEIHCVFYYEQQRYCIQRKLKPTKSWNDSVQSRLRTLSRDPTPLFKTTEMIQDGEHCFSLVDHLLEEVKFTSWRELDDALKVLLPPRELIQSVYLLMQESNHVFELPPAQRITVFKHLFGLIGIDEAKVKLTDRKKEIVTTLHLLEDNDQTNHKFTSLIQSLRTYYTSIKQTDFPSELQEMITTLLQSPTLYDVWLIDSQITLQWFMVESSLVEQVEDMQKQLSSYQKQWYALEATLSATAARLKELRTQESWLHHQLELLEKQAQKATHLYSQLDTQIEQKRMELEKIQNKLRNKQALSFDPVGVDLTLDSALESVVTRIQETIEVWKELAHKITILTQQQTTHQEKKDALQQDIQALDTQIQAVSEKYSQQMYFECDKIQWSCPYVEVIKWSAVKSLVQQKEILTQQKTTKLQQLDSLKNDSSMLKVKQQIDQCISQKNQAWVLLAWLHRKKTLTQREECQILKTEIAVLHTTLQNLQSQRQSIQIPDPQVLDNKKTLLTQQRIELQTNIVQKTTTLEEIKKAYAVWMYSETDERSHMFQKLHTILIQWTELIATYREKHQKIQLLKDELKRNKQLIAVFSKELMVVALQDFLPSLETVINTFLDEVVTYQIRFLTPESLDDSLKLDIEIHDHRGVRQVKSLSGWQRATLKIARILAVSSLFNGQFLFLDETITSLDNEAVARIGRLLESYMSKRDTKLLLITHASQIQEMEMRDRVVTL